MKIKKISVDKARDTGLAMVLIFLLVAYCKQKTTLILPALVVLILTMTWPMVFRPLAHVWFGLSNFMGHIVSKVLLTLVFFIIVTPVGLIRRMRNVDSMRIKVWKKGSESAFFERNHIFSSQDLERPY
ncbi:MAG: hypothetical protein ACMUIA_09460 [bacterium]